MVLFPSLARTATSPNCHHQTPPAFLPASQFAREIVISRLLGHGTLPARPILTRAEPAAADAWCEDGEFPWREVSHEEYRRAREGEVRWHYEDATEVDEEAAS